MTESLSIEEMYKAALEIIAEDRLDEECGTPSSARRNIARAALDGNHVFRNDAGTVLYNCPTDGEVLYFDKNKSYNGV